MVCVSLALALPCAGEATEVSSHSGRSRLQRTQEVSSRLGNEAVVLGAMLEYNGVCACVCVCVCVCTCACAYVHNYLGYNCPLYVNTSIWLNVEDGDD